MENKAYTLLLAFANPFEGILLVHGRNLNGILFGFMADVSNQLPKW